MSQIGKKQPKELFTGRRLLFACRLDRDVNSPIFILNKPEINDRMDRGTALGTVNETCKEDEKGKEKEDGGKQ